METRHCVIQQVIYSNFSTILVVNYNFVLFCSADGNYEVRYKSNVLIYPDGEVLWVPPAIYQVNICYLKGLRKKDTRNHTRCLKINQKFSFNISASEATLVLNNKKCVLFLAHDNV